MSIVFKPYGSLDVSTDPASLPQSGDKINIESGEMKRCKNLRLNEAGVAHTRHGINTLNASALSAIPNMIAEHDGDRYTLGTSIYKNETSIGSGFSSAQWSAIEYNSYLSSELNLFAINGYERRRVDSSAAWKWGIDAPTTAPTIVAGASTGLTGDYNVKYTWARKSGSLVLTESNPSPAASAAATLSDQSLSITWPAHTDFQVTHVRIYRTTAGGSTYYHDQDVEVTDLTVDTTTADTALGTEVATDHDRPPLGSMVIGPNYDGTTFVLKDNLLYYSKPKQPEYFPSTYFVEVSPPQRPLKSGCFWNSQLYVASKNEIYLVQGTGALTFFPVSQSAITGSPSIQGMYPVAGVGIYHVGRDGVYLFNSSQDRKITQGRFDKIFQGQSSGNMPAVATVDSSWIVEYENRIYFGYRAAGNSYPRHVIVTDMETKRSTYYDWGIEIPSLTVDRTNDRLLAVDSSGFVWHLENRDETTDNGTAVEWDIESKDFTLSTRSHFPRMVKYDVDASRATVAGKLTLDGVTHQTHVVTGNRKTKRRLVGVGNGKRCSLRLSGSGPVSIYQVESE